MSSWSSLSVRERSRLMREYIRRGITSLQEMEELYEAERLLGSGGLPVVGGINSLGSMGSVPSSVDMSNSGAVSGVDVGGSMYGEGGHLFENGGPKERRYAPSANYADSGANPQWLSNLIDVYDENRRLAEWVKSDRGYKGEFAAQKMADRIKAVENSKKHPRGGWDEATQRWYPHESKEGGEKTIAYGFKLFEGTPVYELVKKQGYLTDQQAEEFLHKYSVEYLEGAKRVYDSAFQAGDFDKLSPYSQSILGDFHYNPGLTEYPKLAGAFHEGDMQGILDNYKRYLTDTDIFNRPRKRELGRNKFIREELDSLGTFYPIFREK
jgi:hypothetical protein